MNCIGVKGLGDPWEVRLNGQVFHQGQGEEFF